MARCTLLQCRPGTHGRRSSIGVTPGTSPYQQGPLDHTSRGAVDSISMHDSRGPDPAYFATLVGAAKKHGEVTPLKLRSITPWPTRLVHHEGHADLTIPTRPSRATFAKTGLFTCSRTARSRGRPAPEITKLVVQHTSIQRPVDGRRALSGCRDTPTRTSRTNRSRRCCFAERMGRQPASTVADPAAATSWPRRGTRRAQK